MLLNDLDLILNENEETSSKPKRLIQKLGNKLKGRDLKQFSTSLARLLRGGVPILRTFQILQKEIRSKSFKATLSQLEKALEQGKSLSSALESEGHFPIYYVDMIKAGEISGTLDQILGLLSKHLEDSEDRKRKIREALAYPMFVLGFGILAMAVLFQWVIPKILPVYDSFGGKLPALTAFTLKLSEYFVPGMILLLALTAAAIYFLKKSGVQTEFLFSRAPLLGELFRQKKVYQFGSLLSLLLESGVPIVSALQAAGGDEEIKVLISEGKSFSASCQGIRWIKESQLALIHAGEEAGQLPEALKDMSEDAAHEMESRIQILMKLLEPSLILLVGLATGFVVLSVILPIIEMNGLVQ